MKSYLRLGYIGFRAITPGILFGIVSLSAALALAAPQYDVQCDDCHTMPPLDSASGERDPATGAFKGNHQGHAASDAASCARCHGAGVLNYATGHRTKTIQVQGNINNSPLGASYSRGFFNQTSVPPAVLGTCNNVNCHFESLTPSWGSSLFAGAGDCARCHGTAPNTGNHPVAGSKHGTYYGTGTASCLKCHPDHLGEAKPFAHATSAAHRGVAVRFNSSPNSGGSYSGSGLGFLPSQHKASFGSCFNLYCHSNGTGGAPNVVPTWGASLDCKGCHNSNTASGAPMTSGKHGAHVNNAATLGTNFSCADCHARTVQNDTAIADTSRHVNGFADFSGVRGGRTYSSATGVCSTVYCHSDGKGTYKDMTLTGWKSAATLDCKGCHGSAAAPAFSSVAGEPNYPNGGAGQPRANTHQAHVTGAGACYECHVSTVDSTGKLTGSAHTNGSVDVSFNTGIAGPSATWTSGTKTCSGIACHSDGTSVATGVTTGGTIVWGSTSSGCTGCHNYPPSYATGSPKANSHQGHLAYGCNSCHVNTTSDGVTITGSQYHLNKVYDVAPGAGASFAYTFSTSGGSCSSISCHQGGNAKWGVVMNHTAALSSGVILMVLDNEDHGPGFGITENCVLCHSADLPTQHAGQCALCHAGTSPPADSFGATAWNQTCQQGACHPTMHAAMTANHNGIYDGTSASCDRCHDTQSGDFPGSGDNCSRCHSPAFTAASVGDHQPPVTSSNGVATYIGDATITLSATDVGSSGVSYTRYSFDGGPWVQDTAIYVRATSVPRAHTLQFFSADHAMNVEAVKTLSFTVSK